MAELFGGFSLQAVVNIILAILLIVSIVGYRMVVKKHRDDPEYQRKLKERMAERAREERRVREEDNALETYMSNSDNDYSDDQ